MPRHSDTHSKKLKPSHKNCTADKTWWNAHAAGVGIIYSSFCSIASSWGMTTSISVSCRHHLLASGGLNVYRERGNSLEQRASMRGPDGTSTNLQIRWTSCVRFFKKSSYRTIIWWLFGASIRSWRMDSWANDHWRATISSIDLFLSLRHPGTSYDDHGSPDHPGTG